MCVIYLYSVNLIWSGVKDIYIYIYIEKKKDLVVNERIMMSGDLISRPSSHETMTLSAHPPFGLYWWGLWNR